MGDSDTGEREARARPAPASTPPIQSDRERHAAAYDIRLPYIVHSRADIAGILQARREALGLTCLGHDDRAGFHDGYTGKLENPDTPSGKRGFHIRPERGEVACSFMAEVWLQSLGVALVVMSAEQAEAIGAVRAPERPAKRHAGPVAKVKSAA